MAKGPRLKVYRTAAGFNDAYVAASSRKAALAAWGSDADLFARGVAEEVTDPVLTAEPLASPGVVVKRSRGTVAEQIAALPPDRPRPPREEEPAPPPAKPARAKPAPKPKPPPDRAPLDAAEAALAEAEARQAEARGQLDAEEARLKAARVALEQEQAAERERLQGKVDSADTAYRAKLKAWRG